MANAKSAAETSLVRDGQSAGFQPYAPRHFRPLPLRTEAGFRIKPCWISLQDEGPDERLMGAVDVAVRHVAGEASDLGEHHGEAFLILHRGTDGIWLLFDGWVFQSIFGTLRCHAEPEPRPRFDRIDDPRLNACVWEGIVAEHERQAWIRWMLTDAPDAEAYRNDRLAPGWH